MSRILATRRVRTHAWSILRLTRNYLAQSPSPRMQEDGLAALHAGLIAAVAKPTAVPDELANRRFALWSVDPENGRDRIASPSP